MEQKIKVKHINELKGVKAKISETGDISHELTFDVLLDYGDLERLLMMFKQKIPVTMEISSPQSRMDLKVELIMEKKPAESIPVDTTTLSELKTGMDKLKVEEISAALKTSPFTSKEGEHSADTVEVTSEGQKKAKARK